mgnify:CR=1 FL=1
MYVVGGADGAVKEAIYLSKFAKTLTIIHFEEQLGCIAEFKQKVKLISTPALIACFSIRSAKVFPVSFSTMPE